MHEATIIAVCRDDAHRFSKAPQVRSCCAPGLGVEGDAHSGVTVQHRSRVARDPRQPNLRQLHLIHAELLEQLNAAGFDLRPGDMGENVTTRNLELLGSPPARGFGLGAAAMVEVTGLRNPCVQLDRFRSGLMEATLDRDAGGGWCARRA